MISDDDLRAMRARAEALRQQPLNRSTYDIREVCGDLMEAVAEVVRLKLALRFYADRDNWVSKLPDGRVAYVCRLSSSSVDDDHGRLAQAVVGPPKAGA